ncbi:MAG TPA: aspartate--tRNA ligase [Bacteroidales bacterium]|nr:aspartate--tRNA ligase [Bacteroidales bacterium]HOH22786.1 aspartate--tRNA ligase [Bacteroidales bacterium]HPB57000.1 aspartate--tRNA ligase [Bacteroidales bacterium]HPZ03280.1 aspartate--tRNA ligase [Bacteroidales bacterium]HQB74663.1 aspartate--tRNA ligase [Bacteroidales bacterium]
MTAYRTHHCGELNMNFVGKEVTLIGWIQKNRIMGGMIFIDLRDRYGITQLVFNHEVNAALAEKAEKLGREWIIQVSGTVMERYSKNPNIPTGDIEIMVNQLQVINQSKVPPFTIEDQTDGGDELRMKYRYLDLRRNKVKNNLIFRNNVGLAVRNYLQSVGFLEIETPFLIKSTPEGARDFIVPSRIHPGEFYALPQSPQTFKQLLMVSGFDRYFQIVRCFRDEDLRADRQPEFTQIDCEMSFVSQEDILTTFEGLVKHIFAQIKQIEIGPIPRMTYQDAMNLYGSDKPDIRFGMQFVNLTPYLQHRDFSIFNQAEWIGGIVVPGAANYTRKQLDNITEFVRRPQIGASGMVYIMCQPEGTFKSSVDKFYNQEDLQEVAKHSNANAGDLILILSGKKEQTQKQLGELRLEMGNRLELRKAGDYKPLWVVDFPLLEWDEETARFYAKHHPFTAPKPEHIELLQTDPGAVNANAYDLVINGTEIGGGSIRIHDTQLQSQMFKVLGFTEEEAQAQFGFLLDAFQYGAPPHGGIAFGFDRLCAVLSDTDSIRDFIAFPKNNAARDTMIQAPARVSEEQLNELSITIQEREA